MRCGEDKLCADELLIWQILLERVHSNLLTIHGQ
jgi:hypothetical protein